MTKPPEPTPDARYIAEQINAAALEFDVFSKPSFVDVITPIIANALSQATATAEAERDNARREGWQAGYSASEDTYGLLRKRAEAYEVESLAHEAQLTEARRQVEAADTRVVLLNAVIKQLQTERDKTVGTACLSCEGSGVLRVRLDLAGSYEKKHCDDCAGTGRQRAQPSSQTEAPRP